MENKKKQLANANLIAFALTFVYQKLLALSLVIGTFGLILFSLLFDVFIKIIFRIYFNVNQSVFAIGIDNIILLKGLEKTASLLLLSLAFTVLFKILPSTKVAWGDVWLGAMITSILLLLLEHLVSNSIIKFGAHFLSYGVIGNLMILLLWIFLICQILLIGIELTYAYAHVYGSYRDQNCTLKPKHLKKNYHN